MELLLLQSCLGVQINLSSLVRKFQKIFSKLFQYDFVLNILLMILKNKNLSCLIFILFRNKCIDWHITPSDVLTAVGTIILMWVYSTVAEDALSTRLKHSFP